MVLTFELIHNILFHFSPSCFCLPKRDWSSKIICTQARSSYFRYSWYFCDPPWTSKSFEKNEYWKSWTIGYSIPNLISVLVTTPFILNINELLSSTFNSIHSYEDTEFFSKNSNYLIYIVWHLKSLLCRRLSNWELQTSGLFNLLAS